MTLSRDEVEGGGLVTWLVASIDCGPSFCSINSFCVATGTNDKSRRLKVNLMEYRLAVVATFDEKSHSVCQCVTLISFVACWLLNYREGVGWWGTRRFVKRAAPPGVALFHLTVRCHGDALLTRISCGDPQPPLNTRPLVTRQVPNVLP